MGERVDRLRRRRIGTVLDLETAGFRGRVHVRTDGPADAPPVLLLHGFSGSMHWYDLVVPLLARRHRLIRVDLLGHGATGGRAADAPEQARMVTALLAHLGAEDVTAVGHSFGADVAVEVAEHCERVDRLVIVTQAPDYSDAVFPRAFGVMTVPVVGPLLAHLIQVVATVLSAVAALRRGHVGGRELMAQALLDLRSLDVGMVRVVLVERRDRMAARPLDEQVRAAGKPTLVILGERDHFYGARSEARYRAAGAEVVVLPDCGHSPLVELPERSAELLDAFLIRDASPS